jgi:RNase P subunit RPR2
MEYCPHCKSMQEVTTREHRYMTPRRYPAVSVICLKCNKVIRVIPAL